MHYKSLLCAGMLSVLSFMPAYAAQHPTAQSVLCSSGNAAGAFSGWVNINGGLYWTGGACDPNSLEGEVGLFMVPNCNATTFSMQMQLSGLTPGPQTNRYAFVSIIFTDNSSTSMFLANPQATPVNGFYVTQLAHNFFNLTWNPAGTKYAGKTIKEFYFFDEGGGSSEAFRDYITRVYVNGILAAPQVHQSADCPELPI